MAAGAFGGPASAPADASPVVAGTPRPPVLLPRNDLRSDHVPSSIAPRPVPVDANCPQWWDEARRGGWDDQTLLRLDVVMYRESRCEPDAFNPDDPNGGSRGLLQVNGSWTRWLRERGILQTKDDLFVPEVNLAAALVIYRYGVDRYDFGWGPWGYRYKDPYRVSD